MSFIKKILGLKRHENPAIHRLYKDRATLQPEVEEVIALLPRLAETYDEGGRYLLQKTMIEQVSYYDEQYGHTLADRLTEEIKETLLHKAFDLMLYFFYEAQAKRLKETQHAGLLTEALHFQIRQSLATQEGFVAFVHFQNPHYEDSKMLPAHKYSEDVAAIIGSPDLSFTFMVAQQVAVISEVSGKLMRWVLFGEAMDGSKDEAAEDNAPSKNGEPIPKP